MPVASHKFGFGANAVAGLDDITASLPALNPPIDSGPASASSAPMEEPTAPLEGTHRPRRRWTQDEDAKLIAAVDRFGSQRGPGSQWSKISAGLPGRTNKASQSPHYTTPYPSQRGSWRGRAAKPTTQPTCSPQTPRHRQCSGVCGAPRLSLSVFVSYTTSPSFAARFAPLDAYVQ